MLPCSSILYRCHTKQQDYQWSGVTLSKKSQLFRKETHFCPHGASSGTAELSLLHCMVPFLIGFDQVHIKFDIFQVGHELKSQLCTLSDLCGLGPGALRKHATACSLVRNIMPGARRHFTEISAFMRV